VINLHNNDTCLVEFKVGDWIQFDFIDYYNKSSQWKVEAQSIYFDKDWCLTGIDLDTGDDLTFVMKYMKNVEHY
jgi:hypothetical protein